MKGNEFKAIVFQSRANIFKQTYKERRLCQTVNPCMLITQSPQSASPHPQVIIADLSPRTSTGDYCNLPHLSITELPHPEEVRSCVRVSLQGVTKSCSFLSHLERDQCDILKSPVQLPFWKTSQKTDRPSAL